MHWLEQIQADHAAKLTVGQRVRIDLGECPYLARWHGTIEQGVTGRIFSTNAIIVGAPEGHEYAVWFDWPLRARYSWKYAAHELIPIPDRTPEEISRETLARLRATDPVTPQTGNPPRA
jgi:hypothetical protein